MKAREDTLTAWNWRVSTRCNGGQCVQVAVADDRVAMRDSKNPQGAPLVLLKSDWASFVQRCKAGEFDID